MSKSRSLYKQFRAAILEAKVKVLDSNLVKANEHCTYVRVPPLDRGGKDELAEALEWIFADADLMKNVKKIDKRGNGLYTIEIRVEDFYGGKWPT